jgi:O-antigen ligase
MNFETFAVGLSLFIFIPFLGIFILFWAMYSGLRRNFLEKSIKPLMLGYFFLAILLIIVSLLSVNVWPALLGIVNFIPFFVFYLTIHLIMDSPGKLKYLAWALSISCLPIAMIGIAQILWGWGFEMKISQFSLWGVIQGGNPPARMSSIFMHANTYAAYLISVFPLLLCLTIDFFEKPDLKGLKNLFKALFLLSTIALAILSIILTSTRAAWGVLIFYLIGFAIYKSWDLITYALLAVFTFSLVSAYNRGSLGIILRKIVPYYVWARINDSMYPQRPEGLTRLEQFKYAWKLTLERPLTGWGMQNFGDLYQAHAGVWVDEPHNLLLLLTTGVGIPATLGFLFLVGWVMVNGSRLLLDFPAEWQEDRMIYFSYLLAFIGIVLFSMTTPALVDLRANTLSWTILAAVTGLVRVRLKRDSAILG